MNKVLEIKNLNVNYGRTSVLKDVCLDVFEGELLGIIGPNGGGKTTLLKSVLNIIPAVSGEINIFGGPVAKSSHLIGYVPQHAELDRKFPITVFETVLTGCVGKGVHPFSRYTGDQKKEAFRALERVGISDIKDNCIDELSGGQFQRMLIARAIVSSPKMLFLDEPTASVDPASKESIYNLLAELKKDMTVVMVTHDLLAVSSLVDKLACLNRTLVYHGEPELTPHIVDELYGCPVELIAHGVPHRVLHDHSHSEGGSCC